MVEKGSKASYRWIIISLVCGKRRSGVTERHCEPLDHHRTGVARRTDSQMGGTDSFSHVVQLHVRLATSTSGNSHLQIFLLCHSSGVACVKMDVEGIGVTRGVVEKGTEH